MDTNYKLILSNEKIVFTFSSLKDNPSDEKLINFGNTINSLLESPATSFKLFKKTNLG